MSVSALFAVARFGLGARPGELAAIGRNGQDWALAQIAPTAVIPPQLAAFEPGRSIAARTLRAQQSGAQAIEAEVRRLGREVYSTEAAGRTQVQMTSSEPLRERLVAFWSNHFTVSVQRPLLFGLAGAFEREAIRPHVFGRFRDMLHASTRHPAMQLYLDQVRSTGPNSLMGVRSGRGLNENLAREILELHTLGVIGGYTQQDVSEFARVLTGWSIAQPEEGEPGRFYFRAAMHEPGAKTILGRTISEDGANEGAKVLDMLARHPATARHVAEKLVRHFVADRPPSMLVAQVEESFKRSDGDLLVVTRTLLTSAEAWSAPLAKIKTPYELVVAALRAIGSDAIPDPQRLLGALRVLGQPIFGAPSPAGWPDTVDAWLTPEALMRRAEWAMAFAKRVEASVRPPTFFEASFGDDAPRDLRRLMQRAASSADAIALVLASAEFQRR
jgi:uncharacterized protein (DUF1800 family)